MIDIRTEAVLIRDDEQVLDEILNDGVDDSVRAWVAPDQPGPPVAS